MLVHSIFISTVFSDDLFSIPDFENEEEIVEEEIEVPVPETPKSKLNVDFAGTLDLRFVHTGKTASWTERGRGLTYYGANGRNSTSSDTGFKFSRLGVESEVNYEDTSFHIQLQLDDAPNEGSHIGVGEAFLAHEGDISENKRYSARLGLLIPPVSLEHPNSVWSTEYTITPSAINSWIAEEVRPLALEMNWVYDVKDVFPLILTTAIFTNNDPAGSILAWRGWALHDYQWRTSSHLPVQQVPDHLVPDAQAVQPFKEIDDRPGYYAGLKFVSPEHYTISFFHSNSLSRDNVLDESREYSWNTRYEQLAIKWSPSSMQRLTFLSQAMTGHTWMGKPEAPGVAVDFWAFYFLTSYRMDDNKRFSIRWDKFRVDDIDSESDLNDSKGQAFTFAFMTPYKRRQLLSIEYVHVDSRRRGNENYPDDDPDDDLLQLGYRFTY